MVGHISPEAARGGPIAKLRDGDRVRIDVKTRRIDVEANLALREPARIKPRVSTGTLAKYAQLVSSASRGAVTAPGPLDAESTKHREIPVLVVPDESRELLLV